MSKSTLSLLLAFTILPAMCLAQSGNDPLHWTKPIKGNSDNVFLLWSQQNGTTTSSHQQLLKYVLGPNSSLPYGDRLLATGDHVDPTAALGGDEQMDAAAGYFTRSVFEHVVAAWEAPNGAIQLMFPHFDSAGNDWERSTDFTVAGPAYKTSDALNGRIFVRTGDFLGDSLDQFVLAYHGADSTIHIQVYDVNDSLRPHLIASIHNEKLIPGEAGYAPFTITTGDLNGDGKDEIILESVEQNYGGPGHWAAYAEIYEVNGSSIVPVARRVFFSRSNNFYAPELGITAGKFRAGNSDQLAAVCSAKPTDGSNGGYAYIYMLQASQDLSTISFDSSKVDSAGPGDPNYLNGDLCVASGDLDNGGRDELVVDWSNSLHIFAADDSLDLTQTLNGGGLSGSDPNTDGNLSYDYMAIGDVNQNDSADIILERGVYGQNVTDQYQQVAVYGVSNGLGALSEIAHANVDSTSGTAAQTYYHSAVAVGNFDGLSFHVGPPVKDTLSNIVQPLVILNAPPVEFDVFNGKSYDLANCFNGNESTSPFSASYTTTSVTTSAVQTDIHNDYGIGAGINESGDPGAFGISIHVADKVDTTLGVSFDKSSSIQTTYSIQNTVRTSADDEIYATVASYYLWEYPIYQGIDPTPYHYFVIVKPNSVRSQWFQSKSYNTNGYVPNHEVGNVLSYAPYDSLHHNPDISQSFLPVSSAPTFEVGITGTDNWNVTSSTSINNKFDTTWSTSLNESGQLGPVTANGNVDFSNMSTQSISVSKSISIQVGLGALDSLGEAAGYYVTPYLYHATNGAFVLNYAVDLVTSSTGGVPTWWQQHYGKYPDLTFILPWFYDPQKGIYLTENIKRYQTSDIMFSNILPHQGDTISITARVRNFSLVSTKGPVTVKFYVGDPDSGGTIITGTNGIDSVETATAVKARGWSDATIKWRVPSGLPRSPKIFAVVDPSNQIKEVHENNNMGFAVLGPQVPTYLSGIVHPKVLVVPKTPVLYQSYPNPFNPTAQIKYAVPARSLVTLKVYDVLGQKVETLVSGVESPGIHKATFNGSRYASGVYFYRITVRSLSGRHIAYARTMKMMLLK